MDKAPDPKRVAGVIGSGGQAQVLAPKPGPQAFAPKPYPQLLIGTHIAELYPF